MKKLKLISSSPEETDHLGKMLGAILVRGDILTISGETGAGKTSFTRGIATGLGINEEDVSSPTFALVNIYHGRIEVFHIDLYRLTSAEDIEASGIFAHDWDESITIIEWPEIALDILPRERISLKMTYLHELSREMIFEAEQERLSCLSAALLRKIHGHRFT